MTPRQFDSLRVTRDSYDRRDFGLTDDGSATAYGAQDWIVTRVTYHPTDRACPYAIEGYNMNIPPEDADHRFSWRVQCLADCRYDLSNAVLIRGT